MDLRRNKGAAGILIVDDDEAMRDSLAALLAAASFRVTGRVSSAAVLARGIPDGTSCMLIDIRLGEDDDGVDLMARLRREGVQVPVVIITGHADVPLAVRAMREGAHDFVEKPFTPARLLEAVHGAIASGSRAQDAKGKLARLTAREREVLGGLVDGRPNKVVAHDLGISVRTVEAYRATIMSKLGAKSLAELVRTWLTAQGE